ncbi:hypothetical protein Rs2_47250 [Raphanus sativus]|nr:hypothetical protein Rs2_47250 [Raphanus sativus]
MTLIISPEYEDFFSRGLLPKENYWLSLPLIYVGPSNSLWTGAMPTPSDAETIGKRGTGVLKASEVQTVKPPSAKEVCEGSLLCFAEQKERDLLEKSRAVPSLDRPCKLPDADRDRLERWIQRKKQTIEDVRKHGDDKNRQGL